MYKSTGGSDWQVYELKVKSEYIQELIVVERENWSFALMPHGFLSNAIEVVAYETGVPYHFAIS